MMSVNLGLGILIAIGAGALIYVAIELPRLVKSL